MYLAHWMKVKLSCQVPFQVGCGISFLSIHNGREPQFTITSYFIGHKHYLEPKSKLIIYTIDKIILKYTIIILEKASESTKQLVLTYG